MITIVVVAWERKKGKSLEETLCTKFLNELIFNIGDTLGIQLRHVLPLDASSASTHKI